MEASLLGNKKKLRKAVHREINKLEREAALWAVYELAYQYANAVGDEIPGDLSPEQQEQLMRSIKAAEKGKKIPNEEVMKTLSIWNTK